MPLLRPRRGFSMISILISVAIIAILVVMQLKSMQTTMKTMAPAGGSGNLAQPSFSEAMIITQLKQIHVMQMAYKQRYGKYANFDELVEDGSIPKGYSAREDSDTGVAFIRWYDIELHAEKDSYVLLAFPNSEAAMEYEGENLPAYRMDQNGEVGHEDGWDSTDSPGEGEPFDPLDDILGGVGE